MLEEQGVVVRIQKDALWVETRQQSACGSCVAQKGCGQYTVGKIFGTSSVIRVLLLNRKPEDFYLGQHLVIGIPEHVVVWGSLLVYLVPVILLILGASIAHQLLAESDGVVLLGAILGLVLGGGLVKIHAWMNALNPAMQPVLLDGGHDGYPAKAP